mgnify:CR=1 FL=1
MALIVTMLSCIPSSAKEPELDSGYSNIRVEDYVGPEVCGVAIPRTSQTGSNILTVG